MTVILIIVAVVIALGLIVGLGFIAPRNRRGSLEPPSKRRTLVDDRVVPPEEVERAALVEAEVAADLGTHIPVDDVVVEVVEDEVVEETVVEEVAERPRFRDRLGKARAALSGAMGSIAGRSKIDAETWDELEEALILADVGVGSTQELLDHLRARVKADGLSNGEELLGALKAEMADRLSGFDRDLKLSSDSGPTVWLFVGVNGVGKTTTIGKIGVREVREGRTVLMAAGDTFRAAAAEQLGMWAERAGAEFVRGNEGGDPSAVIFDGVEAASARTIDLVLADTAGRLHNNVNLMEELSKVRRVADKGDGTVTEVLLVIDATTGQNGLVQAKQFTEAVELTGVVLTKLDGSAKGGIVIAIHDQLGIPVKLVGLGEGAEDLVSFDAHEFVEALFA
ncbi:MAG: signal recognition particle-docking protein FtsY [Actinomycetota bacterium]